MTLIVRPEAAPDHVAVGRVNRLAFDQDDEANLVDALRAGGFARVSLVAEVDGEVVGHVLFSDLPILTDAGVVPAVALAPLAVAPDHQNRGVGSALVRRGLEACRADGHRICIVLGHATYYPRFGFSAALAERIGSPFDAGPAWMAAELADGALASVEGWAAYPPPFGIPTHARPAYPPDRAEWLRMRAALWPDDHAAEIDAYFAARPPRPNGPLAATATFVATRPAGGLCGFVEASVRPLAEGCGPGPVGYVEGWYVDPDARRQGVGRMLVAAAERWAAGQGCGEMASDALTDNEGSHAAHAAVGFAEVERVVLFRKRLGA